MRLFFRILMFKLIRLIIKEQDRVNLWQRLEQLSLDKQNQ
jgi:hypothetical protein